MTVRFEITTAAGQVHTGPIRGPGGPIGNGAVRPEGQVGLACKHLNGAIQQANQDRPFIADSLVSRTPGHCLMQDDRDDPAVSTDVPLKGAQYRLVHDGLFAVDQAVITPHGLGQIVEFEMVDQKPTGNCGVLLDGACQVDLYPRGQLSAA